MTTPLHREILFPTPSTRHRKTRLRRSTQPWLQEAAGESCKRCLISASTWSAGMVSTRSSSSSRVRLAISSRQAASTFSEVFGLQTRDQPACQLGPVVTGQSQELFSQFFCLNTYGLKLPDNAYFASPSQATQKRWESRRAARRSVRVIASQTPPLSLGQATAPSRRPGRSRKRSSRCRT